MPLPTSVAEQFGMVSVGPHAYNTPTSRGEGTMVTRSCAAFAAPEQLWHVITDFERWPAYLDTVQSVRQIGGPTPVGVGSRFAIKPFGVDAVTYVVTQWDPLRGYTMQNRQFLACGTVSYLITVNSNDSQLTLSYEWSGLLGARLHRREQTLTPHFLSIQATTFARYAELLRL